MKVSVVILNWNGLELLQKFLPSITNFTVGEGIEVVVADNFSTDNSVDFIKKNYPSIRLILLPQNFGYAEGYNKALALVDGEYVILLNSDVEVTKGWIQPIVDYLDDHGDVAALQPKLLAQKNKAKFEYAGASGGFIDKYGYPFCRGRIFDDLEEDKHQYDNVTDVFWATGACLAIRRKDYFEAGGLDASFFAHMEEIDLCWRLNARGRRVVCFPDSVVYHIGGATLSETSPHKTFLNFRNNLLMIYKNMPQKQLKQVFRVRWFLDFLAALQMLSSGKRENAKAVVRARKEFYRIRANYESVRLDNLAQTTNASIATIYSKSLLWSFYIEGKRKFSQLNF